MSNLPRQEVEYEQAMAYIFHMYETRHQIFQFVVTFNSVLLAVVFQYLSDMISKGVVSIIAFIVTLALTLMARRSLIFLEKVNEFAINIEKDLGFGLVGNTANSMPRGIDSSYYLFFVYYLLLIVWLSLGLIFWLLYFGVIV